MTRLIGTNVGHYRIVDLLGEGGMGKVYSGYDETLDRKVALKGLRTDHRINAETKGRFLREARVLSQLAHPNICQIFDYIEAEGADYLVLELIQGQRLTEAVKKELDHRQKLRIAEEIAGVLVAAHGKGIIHRDLKPDNVMLDNEGRVKVLDFGLSRLEQDEPTVALPLFKSGSAPSSDPEDLESMDTLASADGHTAPLRSGSRPCGSDALTRLGTVMGTLGYMSPEQARGDVVAAASDLYSFGLMLQELFTGKRAVDTTLDAKARLEQAKHGETLPVTGIDPDLTALILRLKALEPAARPSAVDVADKLAWIRLKPRRRRLRLLAVTAVTILAAFGAAMAVQSVRATRAEKRARQESETARQVSDFLVGLFRVSDPGEAKGRTVTAREILDAGARRIGTDLKDQPLVRARLLNTMGGVYTGLGLYQDAEPLMDSALREREKVLGPDHPDVAESVHDLAFLYWLQGRYAEAEPLFKRALAVRERALGPDHPGTASTLHDLAYVCWLQGRSAEAEPLFKRALEVRERILGPDHHDVGTSANDLANLYLYDGKYDEAEPLFKRGLAIYEKTLGPDHPDVAGSLDNLAGLYLRSGDYAEAENLYARALAVNEKARGSDHPIVAVSLGNLALLYGYRGDFGRAEALTRRSLAIYEKSLGPEHPYTAQALNNLANLHRDQGRCAEALPLAERALAVREKVLGPDHANTAQSLTTLALIRACQGNRAQAESLDQRVLAIQEKTSGPRSRETAEALRALALDEYNGMRFDRALERCVLCLEIARDWAAKSSGDLRARFLVGSALLLKGRIEAAVNRNEQARASWMEALPVLEPIASSAHRITNQAVYAQILLGLDRVAEAGPIVKRLLDCGYANPDLLAICREKGLAKEVPAAGGRP